MTAALLKVGAGLLLLVGSWLIWRALMAMESRDREDRVSSVCLRRYGPPETDRAYFAARRRQ